MRVCTLLIEPTLIVEVGEPNRALHLGPEHRHQIRQHAGVNELPHGASAASAGPLNSTARSQRVPITTGECVATIAYESVSVRTFIRSSRKRDCQATCHEISGSSTSTKPFRG